MNLPVDQAAVRRYKRRHKALQRKAQAMGMSLTVPANGSRRRIQALLAQGWNMAQISAALGHHRRSVEGVLGRNDRTTWAFAEAIKLVYDELWNVEPPPGRSRTYLRTVAAKRGWASAMAWDDDTIDDPTAEPFGVPPARRQCPTCDAAPMQRCVNLSRGARRKPRDSFHPDRLGTMEEAA